MTVISLVSLSQCFVVDNGHCGFVQGLTKITQVTKNSRFVAPMRDKENYLGDKEGRKKK